MRIQVSEPLALLAIQAGKVPTPASEKGAAGDSQLDSPQRAMQLGEPVPIVFGRRRDGAGGVFISPGATEARFENNVSNSVTAFYHLVLSEGEIDPIEVRDVFQRACRVGSFTQTYNRRAGTWIPENAIIQQGVLPKPEAPYFCGSIGTYPDISTLSFQVTIPNGFTQWDRQVHCFVRGGFRLLRLLGGTGPSDNFADLALLAWRRSRRVPDALIDLPGMAAAAQFLEVNGLRCNIWLQQSRNLADFLSQLAPFFLLGQGKTGGKTSLRPLLPVNSNGTINTDPIDWVFTFTEDTIIPGSDQVQYTSLGDRQPFVAQMIWRQEVGDDVAIIRTSEVAYAGTAESGPFESYDLSEFCTTENHAVKVGAHILARRLRSSHTMRFQVKPQAHNTAVGEGSIVRVKMRRQTPGSAPSVHDHLYQVERILKTLAGNVGYECSHFPTDPEGRSLIALDVAAATATGVLLSSNKTGVSCDVNSSTDESVPTEVFTEPSFGDNGFPEIDGFEIVPVGIPTLEAGFVDTGIGGIGTTINDVGVFEFDRFVDQLTDAEVIAILGDLDSDLADAFRGLSDSDLADFLRGLSDLQLEDLFDGFIADQIRELSDAELSELFRDLSDEAIIESLIDPIKDLATGTLDLDLPELLLNDLSLRFTSAKEEEEENPDDVFDEYTAGLFFHAAQFDANVLKVQMRIAPTGKAPRQDLGPLFASIASTSVVALLPNGRPVSPQPSGLPTVSFSGLIASPWDAEAEGLPVPPPNRIFQGQFNIEYPGSAFPPVAEDPAEQLTYRATVEFNDTLGGFSDVAFLNTLQVNFVSTEAEDVDSSFDFYLIEYAWNGGRDLDTRTSVITPDVLRSADEGKYVGFGRKNQLLNENNDPVLQWAGDQTGVGPEVEHVLLTTEHLPAASSVQFRLAAQWFSKSFGFIQARVYGYDGGSFSLNNSTRKWINTTANKIQLLAIKQVSIPSQLQGSSFDGYDVGTLTIDLETGETILE